MSYSDRTEDFYCLVLPLPLRLALRNSQEGGRAQKVRLELHAVPTQARSFFRAGHGSQVEEAPEGFRLPLASTDVLS